jgi:hypothetical protein
MAGIPMVELKELSLAGLETISLQYNCNDLQLYLLHHYNIAILQYFKFDIAIFNIAL